MNVSLLNYTIHTYHSGTRFHCINPRSREGSDVQMLRLQFSYILISIHAPARGATAATHNHVRSSRFQSTLPRGERRCSPFSSPMTNSNFNPRSREGSDGWSLTTASMTEYFNPRSREGSDQALYDVTSTRYQISIHAPARGATYSFYKSR